MADDARGRPASSPSCSRPSPASGSPSRRCSASSRPRSTPRSSGRPQPRFHGRHQLNRHPDGLEKCVGCELCAWACPADAIYVEGADNDDTEGGTAASRPGERYGRVYQINYLRCIFCGLCIEACPTRALTMTNFYELADNNRGRADLREGAAARPAPGGHAPAAAPDGRRAWRSATTTRARWPRRRPSSRPGSSARAASGTHGAAGDRGPVEGVGTVEADQATAAPSTDGGRR